VTDTDYALLRKQQRELADLEADASQALNVLMMMHPGVTRSATGQSLAALTVAMRRLGACLSPMMIEGAGVVDANTSNGYDYVHPIKVAELAMSIDGASGAPREDLLAIGMAAALMNFGYLAVRPALFGQPRPLSVIEMDLIRTHPAHSVTMLKESGLHRDVLQAIAEHHEHWDGSGYPAGKSGKEISRCARILKIADACAALPALRPHRSGMAAGEAIDFVTESAGTMFDPELVTLFVEHLAQQDRAGLLVVDGDVNARAA
jgi:HD-GYP domain-containing protein (c-di-GMP phosphodiesterase class II)